MPIVSGWKDKVVSSHSELTRGDSDWLFCEVLSQNVCVAALYIFIKFHSIINLFTQSGTHLLNHLLIHSVINIFIQGVIDLFTQSLVYSLNHVLMQSEWGIFRMLCRMPQSWSQRLRLNCWLQLSCGLIMFFDHYSLQ